MNIAKLIPSLISLSGIAIDLLKNRKKEDEVLRALNAYENEFNDKVEGLYKEIEDLKNILRLLFLGFGVLSFLLIVAFVLIIFLIKRLG